MHNLVNSSNSLLDIPRSELGCVGGEPAPLTTEPSSSAVDQNPENMARKIDTMAR